MAKLKAIRSKVTLHGELMFPNDYVSAPELKERDVHLTISAVSKEMLQKTDGKSKGEMVIRFQGTTKKFVCNKTNATTIASIYGTKAEEWIGKRVTLYPTKCLAFGEMVDCIRVREKSPDASKVQALPPESEPPDDFPAAELGAALGDTGLPTNDGQDLIGGSANTGGPNRIKPAKAGATGG